VATKKKLQPVWNWVKSVHEAFHDSPTILKLRANFEQQEAIYVEKGALRVRVSDICGSVANRTVSATVEEVEAPGLGVGLFDKRRRKGATPRRWSIAAGYLTTFSEHCWEAGYGGWSLYFDPKAVEAVLELASRFPDEMDTFKRYNEIIRLLQYGQRFPPGNFQKVFPAER
jgi:hypothetical protein